jgi:uncharacterized protein involved in outer membrane biogenesis
MIKNFLYISISLFIAFFVYINFIFDINNYKSNLEKMISDQANIEFKILGDLNLDLGIQTKISAESLSVRKNKVLIFESETFNASVSLTEILKGRFDIDSLSFKDSKLYGINIDESIIKSYNIIAGRTYKLQNIKYSDIELIEAKGYFEGEFLQIEDMVLDTELIEGNGFGKINPFKETINISASTFIKQNDYLKSKYSEFYPKYLIGTQLPVLISGNFDNPNIDINVSDIVTEKLKKEIKERGVKSIKDKIKEKLESEINIKLPF